MIGMQFNPNFKHHHLIDLKEFVSVEEDEYQSRLEKSQVKEEELVRKRTLILCLFKILPRYK